MASYPLPDKVTYTLRGNFLNNSADTVFSLQGILRMRVNCKMGAANNDQMDRNSEMAQMSTGRCDKNVASTAESASRWTIYLSLLLAFLFCIPAQAQSNLVPAQTWSQTGSLGAPRALHTATLLPSGKVLVTGGRGDNNTDDLATAELYDPASGIWSTASPMSAARSLHTATLLPSGKVLVVGGTANALVSAEIYDPATNTWSAAASLAQGRYNHTANLLQSGQILVAGGFGGGWLASAELYDPASDKWVTVGSLATARSSHTATLLLSGQVLVTAGLGAFGTLNTAEIYDPASKSWSFAGSLFVARINHTATRLPSGKVLITGGANSAGNISSSQIYDPVSKTWGNAASLNFAREVHTATLLPSGLVLIVGGGGDYSDLVENELYNPASDTWSVSAPLNTPRELHTATLLSSGRILVAGGYSNGTLTSSVELYGDTVSVLLTRFTSILTSPQSFNGTWFDFSFGLSADMPFVMQVNDGELAKPVVYRPSTGFWYINLAGSFDFSPATTQIVQFGGLSGDIPQIINIAGVDHIAIYRGGKIILDTDNNSYSVTNALAMGSLAAQVPATVSEVVSNGAYFSGDWNGFSFGLPGDVPLLLQMLPGDNKLPVVFRPANATWYINLNEYNNYTADGTAMVSFGLPGDIPQIVYWNGADHIAVYRPVTGQTIVNTNNQSYNGSNALVL